MAKGFIFLLLAFFCLKGSPPPVTEFTGAAMSIPYRILVGDLSQKDQKRVHNAIAETFTLIDTHFNQWNPYSEASYINAGVGRMEISEQMQSFLQLIERLVTLSEGQFDPTIEPAWQLWKARLTAGRIPSEQEIEELRAYVGWSHIDLRKGYLIKRDSRVKLNFDAVAKGYAVDILLHKLAGEGYRSIYVEWGGEIKTLGEHPSLRPWNIEVAHLPGLEIAISDLAIATSGDYYQKWPVAEKLYTHIVNPNTLKALEVKEAFHTTSVITSSCAAADALATAAMIAPKIWREKVEREYPSIQFISGRGDSIDSLLQKNL